MSADPFKTSTVLVFGILQDYPGGFLTALEIFSKIQEKHSYSLDMHTIRAALLRLEALGNIESRVQRMGSKEIPTKVFKQKKDITTCSESI